MRKLRLDMEALEVQSFSVGVGAAYGEAATGTKINCEDSAPVGTVFAHTGTCRSDCGCGSGTGGKPNDYCCLNVINSTRPSACCGTGCTDHPC